MAPDYSTLFLVIPKRSAPLKTALYCFLSRFSFFLFEIGLKGGSFMYKALGPQSLVVAEVKVALEEISAFRSEALDAQRAACVGSAEWHKRTGEILAYAMMTALLSRIEEAARPLPN
jgi:hypothetical protein